MVPPIRNDTNGMGLISMSERDVKRIQVLAEVRASKRTVVSAAAILELGVRQTFRLMSRYEAGGAGALIHQARGRASNRQLSAGIREYAVELVRTKYADFGPTLATEILREKHSITIGRETLRRWLMADGLWLSRKQRKTFHQPRLRRERFGELVQIDGSDHPWFEARGEPCTLLVFIDDATSRLMQLRFVLSESTDSYAAQPENTLVISPDNRSRQQINEAIRNELRSSNGLAEEGHQFQTLVHRSDMTGADRTWAARYNSGEVLQYTTGSKELGIERNSFARIESVDPRTNTLTVRREDGESVSYDPRRLRGVNVFREAEREFAAGDRIQFTGQNKDLNVSNRDLRMVTDITDNQMTVKLDGKIPRTVTFDPSEFKQFDHGYAVTSYSSQGMTAERVLANIDTDFSRSLINERLAYVAISRASDDARIYTNNAETLGQRLATDISKTSALSFDQAQSSSQHVSQADGGISQDISKPLELPTPEIELPTFGISL
jgi:hypothetical protein